MKVILNKDIPSLGEEGDIKDVARGYARNYLIPNKLVMPYTRDALSILESRREQLAKRKEEKRTAALDIKTRLEMEELVLEMPAGDRGRLFGSVTSATIADALASRGVMVERKRIDIPEKTIKTVGTVRVRVRLYGEEEAELKVVVNAAGGKGEVPAQAEPTPPEAASQDSSEDAAVAEAPETVGDDESDAERAPEEAAVEPVADGESDSAAAGSAEIADDDSAEQDEKEDDNGDSDPDKE